MTELQAEQGAPALDVPRTEGPVLTGEGAHHHAIGPNVDVRGLSCGLGVLSDGGDEPCCLGERAHSEEGVGAPGENPPVLYPAGVMEGPSSDTRVAHPGVLPAASQSSRRILARSASPPGTNVSSSSRAPK